MNKSVVICSGGLDSTVLLYHARALSDVSVLSFDYGQRHSKELDFAARTCAILEIEHEIVDLTCLQPLLRSTLTFQGEVPHGHYAAETMKATVVPNRNAIMLAIAFGHAISIGADRVLIGAHSGDHAIYPDCRPEFFYNLQTTFARANSWADPIPQIDPLFIHLTKAEIVSLGQQCLVPFNDTWSCYEGGAIHCGQCGTCVERAEAFALAGVPDPTLYADPLFWRTVLKDGPNA